MTKTTPGDTLQDLLSKPGSAPVAASAEAGGGGYSHMDWVKTSDAPPTIPAFLADREARFGERELLVSDHGRLTYREAALRSARLAARLLEHGIGKGGRVGLLLPNGPEFVVAWLAVTQVGAVAAPLSTLSSEAELARLIRFGGFALLIGTARALDVDLPARIEGALGLKDSGPAIATAAAPHLRAVWLWSGRASWAGEVERPDASALGGTLVAAAAREVQPSDPMTIIYTSGSTAAPKGVLHSHGAFLRSSRRWAASMPFKREDRFFTNVPMFWVGGLITSLLSMMQVGATLVTSGRSGAALLDVIERERCTIIQVWPALAHRIVNDPSFAGRDFSAIRAGSVRELVPPHLRPAASNPFGFAMGMTETAGPHTVAMNEVDAEHEGAMGLVAPGMEHRIVDPHTGAILAEGEQGELHVRGDTLMLGYEGRERSETFDPDGWFATGDLCSIRDRHVFFHGRRDAMIKTAGANVAPAEVEAALLTIEAVGEAHVLGLPDEARGQIVAALLIAKTGRSLDLADVSAEARRLLSPYKVPRRMLVAGSAPTTATGKLDRRAAIAMLQEMATSA